MGALWAFVGVATLVIVTPGPDTALTVRNALLGGRRAGMATAAGTGDPVAVEFVGGSVTSAGLGETDLPAGGGVVIKGNDKNPHTDPSIIEALKGINPWVDQADFDHHGYGLVKASRSSLDVRLRRVKTIKQRSKTKLPDIHYAVKKGQKSIIGKSS